MKLNIHIKVEILCEQIIKDDLHEFVLGLPVGVAQCITRISVPSDGPVVVTLANPLLGVEWALDVTEVVLEHWRRALGFHVVEFEAAPARKKAKA